DRMLELIKEVDPDHAIYYTENAENYINSIIETDQAFLEDLENIENKTIYFVGHHALQAFEIHYGLTIIPLEDSITPGADPTGPQVSSFILKLKENHVNYLFYQETISKNVVDSIAERAGVNHISILHGFHQITQV